METLDQDKIDLTPKLSSNPHFLQFHGQGSEILLLILQNLFYTLITAGLYLPWAKTRMRRYIWSHTHILGSPLSYEGTPWEILKGYLKLALIYAFFLGTHELVTKFAPDWIGLYAPVMIISFAILLNIAIYGVLRYLINRTSWRGIHFRLEGSATVFGLRLMLNHILTIFTLGHYFGAMIHDSWNYLFNHLSLGTTRFKYQGRKSEALRISLLGVPLCFLSLGLYVFWLKARFFNYVLGKVKFQDSTLDAQFTGGFFLKVFSLKVLGTALTLGIAWPWIKVRILQSQLCRLKLVGHLDLGQTAQISINEADLKGGSLSDATGAEFPGFDLGL